MKLVLILMTIISNVSHATVIKCPPTKLENLSDEPWNPSDVAVYNQVRANNQCPTRYKDSPCIARFIKKEPQMYHVSCGPALGKAPKSKFVSDPI